MTSAPATDLRLHYRLFEPLLKAAIDPNRFYEFGRVPGVDGNKGTQPAIYALLDVQRRPYAPQTLSAHTDVTGWALTVVGVGTTRNEAAWVLGQVTEALEELVVTLDGQESTPLLFDVHDPIRPDGDRQSGRVSYTYVL